jgi:type IV secretory pathway component VirB8
MDISEGKILIILMTSFAAVFSYMFIRRIFWFKEETKEATYWYNQKISWQVRKEDLEETSKYVKKSIIIFGLLALISWLILIFLLQKYQF